MPESTTGMCESNPTIANINRSGLGCGRLPHISQLFGDIDFLVGARCQSVRSRLGSAIETRFHPRHQLVCHEAAARTVDMPVAIATLLRHVIPERRDQAQ